MGGVLEGTVVEHVVWCLLGLIGWVCFSWIVGEGIGGVKSFVGVL